MKTIAYNEKHYTFTVIQHMQCILGF